MPSILSIQSSVAYGHVGNSVAAFALMRLGIEVWPVLTVHFSNHTGYGSWRGPWLDPEQVAEVVRGVDERGVLNRCDAVLSGYLGNPEMASVILDAVTLVKQRNPQSIYCCDPVMGDVDRGVYVAEQIPALIRDRVLPAADVLTPNHFELDLLTKQKSTTLDQVLEAVGQLRAAGPRVVLVTSVVHDQTAPGTIEMLAVDDAGAWQVTTPRIDADYSGTGDLTSALFLAALLRGAGVDQALGSTAASVYGLLAASVGSRELRLIEAQDSFVTPARSFAVHRVSSSSS